MNLRYSQDYYDAGNDFRAVANAKFEEADPDLLHERSDLLPYEQVVSVSSEQGFPCGIPPLMHGYGLFDLYRTIPGREEEEMARLRQLGKWITNPRLQLILEDGPQAAVYVSGEGTVRALYDMYWEDGTGREITPILTVPEARLAINWLLNAEVVGSPPAPLRHLRRPFSH